MASRRQAPRNSSTAPYACNARRHFLVCEAPRWITSFALQVCSALSDYNNFDSSARRCLRRNATSPITYLKRCAADRLRQSVRNPVSATIDMRSSRHPPPDGPWIFNRRSLQTPAASEFVRRIETERHDAAARSADLAIQLASCFADRSGSSAEHDDNQLFTPIYIHVLTEDAHRLGSVDINRISLRPNAP